MQAIKTVNIGVVIGSQRVVRIGPQVADFVVNTIKRAERNNAESTRQQPTIKTNFETIDLAQVNLPLFDEPGIPNQIKSPEGYVHEHTRRWSRRIAALDGFVFVTAQRNWGIPAELKNAIDYLFNEWSGKPAVIVTYGGRGGQQCAAQLETVLRSIGVDVDDGKSVNMAFPSPEFRVAAFEGRDVGLDAEDDEGPWSEHGSEIVKAWYGLVGKVASSTAGRQLNGTPA